MHTYVTVMFMSTYCSGVSMSFLPHGFNINGETDHYRPSSLNPTPIHIAKLSPVFEYKSSIPVPNSPHQPHPPKLVQVQNPIYVPYYATGSAPDWILYDFNEQQKSAMFHGYGSSTWDGRSRCGALSSCNSRDTYKENIQKRQAYMDDARERYWSWR